MTNNKSPTETEQQEENKILIAEVLKLKEENKSLREEITKVNKLLEVVNGVLEKTVIDEENKLSINKENKC